jgi:hypothetical protein
MPAYRAPAVPDGWPAVLAHDLDVAAAHGLTRLLDVVHPPVGGRRLVEWLLGDPPPVETIRERQASVAELRAHPALLVDVAAEARHGGAPATPAGLAALRAWCDAAESPSGLGAARVVAAACVAAVVVAFIAAGVEGALRVGGPAVLVQLVLSGRARHRLQRALGRVDLALQQIAGVARVLALLEHAADVPGALGAIQRRLRGEHAVASLGALARLLAWNETRHSPMAHWALNAAVGFDVHLAHAFARWRRTAGAHAGAWLDLAADAEALLALGTLAFEHPRWTLPAVHDDPAAPALDARGLAHPLLAPETAVPNDLALAAPGTVLVLSGSNMAGKTTFLRAVGLNVLLAQAGGAVCADALSVRRARVRSSVRVEDDLDSGTSLFLAEATRLRDVIRDAEAEGPPVLFLFDEILHGTNAPDRREATRVVLRRLARAGAFGLVTTHDPEVGVFADGAGVRAPQQAHFAGRVEHDAAGRIVLGFDYRMRPGPAREANARAVLERLGITDVG